MINHCLIFFSHFDMRLFSEARYYRSVPDLLDLHLFEGLTVPKFLPFQAFCDTSETETWKNWTENMKKKIV